MGLSLSLSLSLSLNLTVWLVVSGVGARATEYDRVDPYETLHVSANADVETVKRAYHEVADTLVASRDAGSEQKLAEVVEAYQEVLDAAYAQEQSLTYEEAPSVNVAMSNDAMLGHVSGGGGYGLTSVGSASEGGRLATGPRLCMVMYASQKWRWGLRWNAPHNVVGGGQDRGGPYTTHGEYDQDRRVRWVKHYVESHGEVLYEGVKEGDTIRGMWTDANSGNKGTFEMQRAH